MSNKRGLIRDLLLSLQKQSRLAVYRIDLQYLIKVKVYFISFIFTKLRDQFGT